MTPVRLGIIGLGKIARDRHLPAIAGDPVFMLCAVADPQGAAPGAVPMYRDHEALLGDSGVDAVAICTPPTARFAIAQDALAAGKHVLLEKPPTATVGELRQLEHLAARNGCVLFTAWHSQHNVTVDRARDILRDRTVAALRIEWKEDVEIYHPGQAWIWEPGGFGVFDAGVNGLSMLTRLLPEPLFVRSAELFFQPGRQAPIAADVAFSSGGAMTGVFDWRSGGVERREIRIETAGGGSVELTASGGRLVVDGAEVVCGPRSEYPMIYRRFAQLLSDGTSEVDAEPLRLVADAFMVGRRTDLPGS